jgi:glycosyltransferase involved in cell wall biosynthesis
MLEESRLQPQPRETPWRRRAHQTTMRIGVYTEKELVFSMRVYRGNVERELRSLGAETVELSKAGDDAKPLDVIWDHQAFAGRPPLAPFRGRPEPCVATQHGARPLVLPLEELGATERDREELRRKVEERNAIWQTLDKSAALYIAVSEHTKREVVDRVGLPEENVTVIHHGVDHEKFFPDETAPRPPEPFFFHCSQYQPVKNVDRILEAYASIPVDRRPPFRIVASGYGKPPRIEGLSLQNEPISDEELVRFYQTAMAFVFPSLHEGFGLPLVEAMACGCPVLTSNVTACPEIVGEAGLKVDPRSTEQIAEAMTRLAEDRELRRELRAKGLEQAKRFTWRASGQAHLRVLEEAVRRRRNL